MAELAKKKGVADIVFLLDVTGSMQDCIDAVKSSVNAFITELARADVNNALPVKDWRVKVCGFRDHTAGDSDWWVDNPFVRDAAAVQAQLADPRMQASGGGDEAESLLDALYKVATMGAAGAQEGDLPDKWRAAGGATRAVICFTDATFKTPMTIPGVAGGTVADVVTALTSNRIVLLALVPEWTGYFELGSAERAEVHTYVTAADTPALAGLGKPGAEGSAASAAAIAALKRMAADTAVFTKLMQQLARTVTVSAPTEVA